MASFILNTPIMNDIANAINNDSSNGFLQIYTGAGPGPGNAPTGTLLANLTLPPAANNTVANGVITFGAISQVNANNTGTANYFMLFKSAGPGNAANCIAQGDVSTSGATLNLNTTSIVANGPVAITAFSITVPAGT
jgi:hypothetical protein